MLASFDHPNIAQLHTAFQVDNQLVMMMEFVEGFTLEQIAKQGPIPQSDVINYMQQVLAALSYAHGRGVVHRDIKPANIMVTSQGIVKLMDFGIAKSRTEQDLTRPGTTMGSLYYMSPEQVRGGTVDARSDIYSVGVMMYELLAGRRPFVADSAYEILNQQCNVVPQPPLEVNAQLPPPLSDLIVCAMAKDPANRFQNAQALSNALRQVAAMQNDPTKREEAAYTPVAVPACCSARRTGLCSRCPGCALGAAFFGTPRSLDDRGGACSSGRCGLRRHRSATPVAHQRENRKRRRSSCPDVAGSACTHPLRNRQALSRRAAAAVPDAGRHPPSAPAADAPPAAALPPAAPRKHQFHPARKSLPVPRLRSTQSRPGPITTRPRSRCSPRPGRQSKTASKYRSLG